MAVNEQPLSSGGDGRGSNGRFGVGNKAGRGNPNHKRVAALRRSYLRAISPGDMAAVAKAVLKAARDGDITAARELCDRLLGRPVQTDVLERLEALETALAERSATPPTGRN